MLKPVTNMRRACPNSAEGLSGKNNINKAASGIAEPEVIWEKNILPELGKYLERQSPIFPPNGPPSELAMINILMRTPV